MSTDDELRALKLWLDKGFNATGEMSWIKAGNALIELIEVREANTRLSGRHSVTLNQYQLLRAVKQCGGIFTGSDLTIEYFDEHECEEDGEKVTRPSGLYLYWTEYPEEGSTPLDAGPLTEDFECIVCHVCGNERTIANGVAGTDPRGYSDCSNCSDHKGPAMSCPQHGHTPISASPAQEPQSAGDLVSDERLAEKIACAEENRQESVVFVEKTLDDYHEKMLRLCVEDVSCLRELQRLRTSPQGMTEGEREACRAGAQALCDDWNIRYRGNREYFDKHAATLRALADKGGGHE